MKNLFYVFLLSLVLLSPVYAQEDSLDASGTETGTATGADASDLGDVTASAGYEGVRYGGEEGFKKELDFVTALLESNYILALSLLIGIMGFWQFFVSGSGFGLIMIIMALGLTAFPGVYKGFYAGTRSFVHEASGATDTQGWR